MSERILETDFSTEEDAERAANLLKEIRTNMTTLAPFEIKIKGTKLFVTMETHRFEESSRDISKSLSELPGFREFHYPQLESL